MLGVSNGFEGLAEGKVREMTWTSMSGWASMGGSELGTSRHIPQGSDLYAIARTIEEHQIDALLVIGGWNAYEAMYRLYEERPNFPTFNIPVVCLPASINNNLPGSELSVGADTALNNIVDAVDKIKQSAVATRRCFVVEVMGHWCGYLALMSGLATGAERVYLHEEGVTLDDLQADVAMLRNGFQSGKRLGLMIRNEYANAIYNTNFMCALFEEEGKDIFDVRPAILGHLQQGGDPSPYDRILATRLAQRSLEHLIVQLVQGEQGAGFVGLQSSRFQFHDLRDFPRMVDCAHQRPLEQWWLERRALAHLLAQLGPESAGNGG
jgi:6-phosphofructokinase 1